MARKVVFATAVLMILAAGLMWARVIPLDEGMRPLVAGALCLAAVFDVITGVFFLKDPE